jgi:methyltransferase family protein
VETFDLHDIDRYCSDYGRLGRALGVSSATPAPGELEFVKWVTSGRFGFGMLLPSEIFFAAAITSILRPRRAVEVGTASGFSAAIIAKMINLRLTEEQIELSGPVLHTIDKKAHYVADAGKPVGFAIELIAPEISHRVALHPLRDSSHCRELLDGMEVTLAFVDGNHRHPWPLSDVMEIQQLMKSGWILMHDIDLPGQIECAIAAGQPVERTSASGAKHVFEFWPWERIRSGNIGAIQIPADRRGLDEFLSRMRDLPCEVSSGSWGKRWRRIDSLIGTPGSRRRGLA